MGQIQKVIAQTDNFPDGQKLTQVRVTVAGDVDPESLRVEGRKILAARKEENTILLSLEPEALIPPPPKKEKPSANGSHSGTPDLPPAIRLVPKATVVMEGKAYPSSETWEPVVEEFQKFSLEGMGYNLFVPRLEPEKTYPLVLFLHDAGACGPDVKTTLSQGNGAVSFAEPQWQKEHPCFVLAPQIDKGPQGPMTHDDFTVTEDLDKVARILFSVLDQYPVDRTQVYATGQSMGCMASCELNIRYPQLFAASLLVAGQWDPELMAASCAQGRFWILVSEGDSKALPGMNAVTAAMERRGAKVGRYRWDAKEPLGPPAAKAAEDPVNVRYTVLTGDSVLPEGAKFFPGACHMATWPVVYQIRELKEWLFSCKKE